MVMMVGANGDDGEHVMMMVSACGHDCECVMVVSACVMAMMVSV